MGVQLNCPYSRRRRELFLLLRGGCAEIGIMIPTIIVARRARIGGVGQPFVELTAQSFLRRGVTTLVGDVHQLMRVFREIIKLFGRAFGKRELKQFGKLASVTLGEKKILAGRAVAIAEWSDGFPLFWIARRPTVGAKIANVKELLRANGAGRTAQITFTKIGVALAFDEHRVAPALGFARH